MPKKRISLIKSEHELLVPFIKEPWKKYTFREIKSITGKTSDSYVYDGLKRYVKDNILLEEKAGNIILYSLNLSLIKTQIYAGLICEYIAWNKKHIPYDVIEKIIKKIPTTYFTFIVTGSYANNTQNEKSDIDIVIIVDDSQDTKYLLAQIKYSCELSIPKGHPYIFKKSEFLEMLLNNQANYGKEIVKKNMLFYGANTYYAILQEAILNGFNDKKLSGKI